MSSLKRWLSLSGFISEICEENVRSEAGDLDEEFPKITIFLDEDVKEAEEKTVRGCFKCGFVDLIFRFDKENSKELFADIFHKMINRYPPTFFDTAFDKFACKKIGFVEESESKSVLSGKPIDRNIELYKPFSQNQHPAMTASAINFINISWGIPMLRYTNN